MLKVVEAAWKFEAERALADYAKTIGFPYWGIKQVNSQQFRVFTRKIATHQ